ncbi:MAG: hypothetical protein ACFFC7_30120 [Candidatus Hermodarchaeota archaeon]
MKNYEEAWEKDFTNWTFKEIPNNIQCCRNCATQEGCLQHCIAPDQACFLLRPTDPHPKCPECIAQDCRGFDYTTPRPNFRVTNKPKLLATIKLKTEGRVCWGCWKDFSEPFELIYWCSEECLEAWLVRKKIKSI